MKRRQNNEAQLEKELGRFFKRLKKEVLKGLDEYWSDYQLLQGQVNLMLSPIHEAHKEYYEIIRKYKLREYRLGKAEAKRLIKRANKDKVALKAVTTLGIQGFVDKDKNSLFGTIPKAEEDLLNRTFRTSQNTLNRVDNQLNQIISDGYREGKGINQVANDITQRFDQLADWEARRIARTEINTSHNQATRDQYREDGVEYTQWIAANDDRTRDSHVDVDGEIIPIDGKYSNGLAFPGDTSGPLEEWINCRCSNAPFVVPYGFMAPSFSPFRESDLVPINMESLGEPSQEQLDANLSPEQRSQYEQYAKAVDEAQAVIDSRFSLPRERLQARTQLEYNLSKLNQLKLVANGELARGYQGIIGAVASQPETQDVEVAPRPNLNPMLEGEYKTYTEVDPTSKAKVTVYQYENGFEIAVNENAWLSHEEIVSHIKTLPPELQSISSLKRITIKDWRAKNKGGHFDPTPQEVVVFKSAGSKSRHFEVLNHELGHAYDFLKDGSGHYEYSSLELYEKIFEADNKHQHKINGGKGRVKNVFVTDYAARSYVKYKKGYNKRLKVWKKGSQDPALKPRSFQLGEDFAESVALYHHPLKHDQFVKDFPNRAKYLESLFGKPKFKKNSPYYKELVKEEKEKQAYMKKQKENKEAQEKLDKLTEKQLDKELEKVLGSKAKVKAYHKMKEELHKLDMVPMAISAQEIGILTQNGWEWSIAEDIMKNPNDYLPTVNAKRRKYKNIIEETLALVKKQL